MKRFVLTFALLCSGTSALAADPVAPATADVTKDHIQMHTQMASAHQKAAECLTAGKPESECRSAFQDVCQKSGGPEKCGAGMKPRRMRR